tara:strand:+ start:617 stop:754 length:138 start_codon:yes stop_codon:yes gene_type:complete
MTAFLRISIDQLVGECAAAAKKFEVRFKHGEGQPRGDALFSYVSV